MHLSKLKIDLKFISFYFIKCFVIGEVHAIAQSVASKDINLHVIYVMKRRQNL